MLSAVHYRKWFLRNHVATNCARTDTSYLDKFFLILGSLEVVVDIFAEDFVAVVPALQLGQRLVRLNIVTQLGRYGIVLE
jgi:hypothetical protein